MSRISRKHAILLAGAAAILPFAALNGIAQSPIEAAPPAFSPPRSPMLLTRTLYSPLADGKEVVTRRVYQIVIVPDGEGFRVDGALVHCEVQAPPALAMLAEIERRRPDIGLFPMRLDPRGMIVGGNTLPSSQSIRQAGALVSQAFARSAQPEDSRQAGSFVSQVEDQESITRWPADLFRPAAGHRTNQQAITLPGGEDGKVTVEISSLPGVSRYATVERTVTTELGNTRRTTREKWTLADAS